MYKNQENIPLRLNRIFHSSYNKSSIVHKNVSLHDLPPSLPPLSFPGVHSPLVSYSTCSETEPLGHLYP